jgi:hypothetical protein
MSNIYRIITLLMIISITACVSNQSEVIATNDEDKDIGLGGTGMLANTSSGLIDSGLGGTGILGEITGFGSIFVNGIEIEYDNDTTFMIDGETSLPQQLEIGDVVEVLTINARQHTQAQVINLRHEIIGKVESVEAHTYSFTINGQSIVQSISKSTLPEVGTTVAVAGFRIDEKTILSTRVTLAETGKTLLHTGTELPFNDKAQRWLVQTHVRANTAGIQHNGVAYNFTLTQKTDKSFEGLLEIKLLQLQKSVTGKLELKQVIEQTTIPRGRRTLKPAHQHNGNMLQRVSPGSGTNPASGADSGSSSGSTRGFNSPAGKYNGR